MNFIFAYIILGDYMNNTIISFVLTSLAGFSTMLGTIVIFLNFKNYNKVIAGALSFAAGVMVTVSITDLIPESLHMLTSLNNSFLIIIICILSIILGIIFSMIIDYYLPDNFEKTNNNNLFKVGIVSMFAIIIHNIPEGIATFITTSSDVKLGLTLAIAIALHNIPEGISISVPIYYATRSKKKALLYTFISSISELFGAIITFLFLKKFINNTILGILFAIIAGIMICISFCKLLPTSKKYNVKNLTISFFIIGILFILLKFL